MEERSAAAAGEAPSGTAVVAEVPRATLEYAAPPRRVRWYQFPIRTQLPQVPWLWAGLMMTPWFVGNYVEMCSTTTMTFTLRKFIDHPMLITLVASLNTAYNMLIGATCNYLSDKVWTRFGRRKPFLLASMLSSAVFLLAIPFIGNFWILLALLVIYEAARDVGSPTEALINEVIPPQQRGRAGIVRTFMQQGVTFFFFTIMIAQFDEKYHLTDKLTISGEMLVYWVGAVLALGLAAFYFFVVQEVRPPALPEETAGAGLGNDPSRVLPYATDARPAGFFARLGRFLRGFLRDAVADRQMRFVYLLMFAAQGTWLGLGSLGPLLFTDQWGFDKATYGKVVGYATPIVLIVAPIAGILVDKCNRLKLFIGGLLLIICQHAGYFIYCRYFAPDGRPPFSFLVIYPLCFAIVGQTASLAAITSVFDYLPSSRLGTFGSGWGLLAAITSLAISNGLAGWVTASTYLFPREGVKYDYLSGYLYIILLCFVFLACALCFAREEKKGRLIKYGVLERQQAAQAEEAM